LKSLLNFRGPLGAHRVTKAEGDERTGDAKQHQTTPSSDQLAHQAQAKAAAASPSRVWAGGDRGRALDKGQRPDVRGVRVALDTGYTRVRVMGPAWRNGGVSSSRVAIRPIRNKSLMRFRACDDPHLRCERES
jgi:hypothetical protein